MSDKATIEECSTCGRKIDTSKQPFTSCSKCKRLFCLNLLRDCFLEHRKLYDCKEGTAQSILDPSWVVNLRETKEEEGQHDKATA